MFGFIARLFKTHSNQVLSPHTIDLTKADHWPTDQIKESPSIQEHQTDSLLVPGGVSGLPLSTIKALQKLIASDNTGRVDDDFIAHMLGTEWHWPEFDKWYEHFSKLGKYPYMWSAFGPSFDDDMDASEDDDLDEDIDGENGYMSPPPDSYYLEELQPFRSLSTPTKTLLLKAGNLFKARAVTKSYCLKVTGFRDSEFQKAIAESIKAGFSSQPLSPREKLVLLKAAELKEIAKQKGLQVSGTKVVLSKRIEEAISEDEIQRLIPQEHQDEAYLIGGKLSNSAGVQWEIERIRLLAHTAQMYFYSFRHYEDFKGLRKENRRYKLRTTDCADGCPICKRLEGSVLSGDKEMPPFHPGCRCNVLIDSDNFINQRTH